MLMILIMTSILEELLSFIFNKTLLKYKYHKINLSNKKIEEKNDNINRI